MKNLKKLLSVILCTAMLFGTVSICSDEFAEKINLFSVTSYAEETQPVLTKDCAATDGNNVDPFFKGVVGFFQKDIFSKITFDTDGGNEISPIYAFKFFGKIKEPADPTKEGYTFVGWDTEIPKRAPFRNKSIKAVWKVDCFLMEWTVDGIVLKKEYYNYGAEIIHPDKIKKDGYTFIGWYDSPKTMPAHDVTTTAIFSKDTDIITTSSENEFYDKASGLVSGSLKTGFDEEAAIDDEYYMGRLILQASDYSFIDFKKLKADTVVSSPDGTIVVQFSNSALAKEAAKILEQYDTIKYVETDAYVSVPDDVEIEEFPESTSANWGKSYISADKYAYYLEKNNFTDNIVVAVVDTGVDSDHKLLNGKVSLGGTNCLNSKESIEDDNGHGTHVSGIIADCTSGISNITIMPIKALGYGKDGSFGGTALTIAKGITWAVNNHADVINLSLGGEFNVGSSLITNEIDKAVAAGIVVIVAAGNNSSNTELFCPANVDSAIVVGAIDKTGTIASFSNYGENVDVCAPGYDIISSYRNGKYAKMCGTSQAAPHIAAIAAMFKLAYLDYEPTQIEALIKKYCKDLGETGRDDYYGVGCPNIYDAIPNVTVKFNSNGGTAVSSKTTKNSQSVVLPNSSKSFKITLNANGGTLTNSSYTRSCTFNGWYTSSSLSGNAYVGGSSYIVLDDQTLYAKWTNPTRGAVNQPTRAGYEFDDWYTSASGGTLYDSKKSISGNITLYAHWKQYCITYDANGGSGAPSATYGYSTTKLSSTKPKRSGYQFLGWSENKTDQSAPYSASGSFNLKTDTKLYAIWGKASVKITNSAGKEISSANYNFNCDKDVYIFREAGTYCYWMEIVLPTASWQYCNDGSGTTGWVVTSQTGDTYISDNILHVNQPGTYKVKYCKNGYSSNTYTITVQLYKVTTDTNSVHTSPNRTSSTTGPGIASGSTVYLTSLSWFCGYYSPNSPAATWAYVTYGGYSGYIIMWEHNEN